MKYELKYTDIALKDLSLLKKHELATYKKALKLISELSEHPTTGTGHPEQLKKDKNGLWSRRITMKHRLVYKIDDGVLTVILVAAYGHYGDK